MGIVTGKALLVVTRNDCERDKFHVQAFVQSVKGSETYYKSAVAEDLGLCDLYSMPFMKRMQYGDVVRVAVRYCISWSSFAFGYDYDNDMDFKIEIEKYRILRRQPWKRDFYTAKADRAWVQECITHREVNWKKGQTR